MVLIRVLVTRPEPEAGQTAARLAGLGFAPIMLPLSRICALKIDAPALARQQGVAVTSINALRHAAPELIESLVHLPCYAVGARTAQAARQAGFFHVEEGQGDAITLAERIIAASSGKLVYLCGKVRFTGFEERLAASGVQIKALETYDTVMLDYTDESIHACLGGQPVGAIMLYSAQAALAMRALLQRENLQILFEKAQVLTLSKRIAEALGAEFMKRVNIARQPSQDALLALLPAP
ncbi:uroporphyrinogen-III synthase [Aquamicrobium segne]|uniref:Uroporphyrinogen-III synthase n=1 Tax=Aquamicrobium segne TaxID=469547 RepID=A0ABW0GTE7_9HYPH